MNIEGKTMLRKYRSHTVEGACGGGYQVKLEWDTPLAAAMPRLVPSVTQRMPACRPDRTSLSQKTTLEQELVSWIRDFSLSLSVK